MSAQTVGSWYPTWEGKPTLASLLLEGAKLIEKKWSNLENAALSRSIDFSVFSILEELMIVLL